MKKIKRAVTTDEMMEDAIKTVQRMTPEEKAKLREAIKLSLMKCSDVIQ